MKEITTPELTRRLEKGDDIVVLDVREQVDYEDWHISGAKNIPVFTALKDGDMSGLEAGMKDADSQRPVVCVCRSGNTSQIAAQALEEMGFDSYSLSGGMHGWTDSWTTAAVDYAGADVVQIRRNGKGCLSYMVGKDGEAAVIDPCLDIEAYRQYAADNDLTIKYILETHVHADHISRAPDLAKATGATLYIPKNDRVQFEYNAIENGQTVSVGSAQLHVTSTPGHTGESVCYNLDGKVLFSGDTIFLEALGRPDLEKGDAGAEAGAALLYDSLQSSIIPLADDVIVCPGHTSDAIGFDGVALADTLGNIKPRIDLLNRDKDTFVSEVVGSLGLKPPNFDRVLAVNEGRADLGFLNPLEIEAGPNRCAVKHQ